MNNLASSARRSDPVYRQAMAAAPSAVPAAPVTQPPPAASSPSPVAIVRVHGRRVSWTLDPSTWRPSMPAFGPYYIRARMAGHALTERAKAGMTVRKLLRVPGVDHVVVYDLPAPGPEGGASVVAVVRRVANDYRTAWSATDAWRPTQPAEGREYEAARALGLAGVVYGAAGLDKVTGG